MTLDELLISETAYFLTARDIEETCPRKQLIDFAKHLYSTKKDAYNALLGCLQFELYELNEKLASGTSTYTDETLQQKINDLTIDIQKINEKLGSLNT